MSVKGLRFGSYELDIGSSELRKAGVRVKLQLQPLRVLALLASHGGQLLTREEIRAEVWPDSSADIEQALNFCIRQIRAALGDNASAPRYIETLPRRGYRFIAPVEAIEVPDQSRDPAADPLPRPARTDRPARWQLLCAALCGAAVALIGAAVFLLVRDADARIPSFRQLTFCRGSVVSARFGPGDQVLYTADWEGAGAQLHRLQLEGLDTRVLEVEATQLLGVSPGDEMILLRSDSTLTRAPTRGGGAKEVLENVLSADWGPGGRELAVARKGPGSKSRIEFPIGHVLCEALRPSDLRVSPGGDRLAFIEHPKRADDRGFVVVVDLAGQRRMLSGPWGSAAGLAWSAGGDEIWFTAAKVGVDSALHAVDLDGRERTVLPSMGRFVVHDIAGDGRVLLERKTLRTEIRYRGPGDPAERDLSWLDHSRAVQLSRDGSQLLFIETGVAGGPEYAAYLRSTDGSLPVRVGNGWAQDLSPDGCWVLSIPVERLDRLELLPTGAGERVQIQDRGIVEYEWAGWLADGRTLLFAARGSDGLSRMFARGLEAGPPRPVTPPGSAVWANTVSPDGELLVAPCGSGACLYPLAGGEPQPLPEAIDAAAVLGWAGPRTLLVRGPEGIPTILYEQDLDGSEPVRWREIGPTDISGVRRVNTIALTPGLDAYAYSFGRQLADLYIVEGLE